MDEFITTESFLVGAPCTVSTDDGMFTNRIYTGGDVGFIWNSCTEIGGEMESTTGATATTGAATAVPTMSEWGLMIFLLLVMNLSLVFLRRLETVRLN